MKTRIFALFYITFCILNINNIPVTGGSTVHPSCHFDYSYAYIYIHQLNVDDFVAERPPWQFLSALFSFAFKKKEHSRYTVNAMLYDNKPRTCMLRLGPIILPKEDNEPTPVLLY